MYFTDSVSAFLAGVASLLTPSLDELNLDFQQMDVNDRQCWPFIIGIDRENQISSHDPLLPTYPKDLYCVRIIQGKTDPKDLYRVHIIQGKTHPKDVSCVRN